LVNYYRPTRDGRLAVGKSGGALAFAGRVGGKFDGASPRAAQVERSLREFFPTLAHARVVSSWTGPASRTMTGIPIFGRLRGAPDVFYALGYSGNGVAPSVVGGRILASLVLGLDDEWARCGVVRETIPRGEKFPPEPFRFVGGQLVRAAIARKERAEDDGRRPGRLVGALAGLGPAGFVPTEERGSEKRRRGTRVEDAAHASGA
jgi:hypothetical protein